MSNRESSCRFRPISDLTEQRIDWLWPGRLALGKPALLEGDPELGTLIALDLCARLSRGRPFPDGSPSPGPTNCLVLNAEDDPRLCRNRTPLCGFDVAHPAAQPDHAEHRVLFVLFLACAPIP
jgi:hypothetical protein